MKKLFYFIGVISLCSLLISGCSEPSNKANIAKKNTEVSSSNKKTELEGKVKIPDPYFKTKEQVKAEFNSVGLTPNFIVSNFDNKATINKRFLRAGECDQLSSEQGAVEYLGRDKVGADYGFYAKKGATIIVGYSDHDFDGTEKKEAKSVANDKQDNSSEKIEVENKKTETTEQITTPVFQPKDVSDETIKSIQTYDDYLTMYKAIIDNYLSNYENSIKDTILYSPEAFEEQKKQYNKSFEEQKKQYEKYGHKKLIGKNDLISFLISYRDNLKQFTDDIGNSIN
ncbi:TPA: hypothetical protein ACU3VQ_001852 [Enterococcus faecalis]|nr:hypothetical protein T481_09720 [Enterococcus faecalis PF3]